MQQTLRRGALRGTRCSGAHLRSTAVYSTQGLGLAAWRKTLIHMANFYSGVCCSCRASCDPYVAGAHTTRGIAVTVRYINQVPRSIQLYPMSLISFHIWITDIRLLTYADMPVVTAARLASRPDLVHGCGHWFCARAPNPSRASPSAAHDGPDPVRVGRW